MRWHAELIIEAALITVILVRKIGLVWWESLIGVDFAANLLQIILYRAEYMHVARWVWIGGVVLALPLGYMAVVECCEMERGRSRWWHVRILAAWVAVTLTCVSLQTQTDLVVRVNHALLVADAGAFIAWAALWL